MHDRWSRLSCTANRKWIGCLRLFHIRTMFGNINGVNRRVVADCIFVMQDRCPQPRAFGVIFTSLGNMDPISAGLRHEVSETWTDMDADGCVALTIVTGDGTVFSAGVDGDHERQAGDDYKSRMQAVSESRKPLTGAERDWSFDGGHRLSLVGRFVNVRQGGQVFRWVPEDRQCRCRPSRHHLADALRYDRGEATRSDVRVPHRKGRARMNPISLALPEEEARHAQCRSLPNLSPARP